VSFVSVAFAWRETASLASDLVEISARKRVSLRIPASDQALKRKASFESPVMILKNSRVPIWKPTDDHLRSNSDTAGAA
jgi:hypothetical protein